MSSNEKKNVANCLYIGPKEYLQECHTGQNGVPLGIPPLHKHLTEAGLT